MKKFSKRSFSHLSCGLMLTLINAQDPFLESRPYAPPSFEQYAVNNHVDHQYPSTNGADGIFQGLDGIQFDDDVMYPDCIAGLSCYDGHGGVDYYMPFDTPILAPGDGYVLWSAFSEPADPCPGGITPNGDQGTIILAHGNGYFSCYLHMNPPLNVSVGETVETGDTLGFAGNTGCAVNSHLHFEIRKDSWYYDPSVPWVVDPFGWWGNENDPIEEIRGNRSEWLWVSSNMVDDGDNGFQRYQGPEWTYLGFGYNNDSWISPVVQNAENNRHSAIWVPWIETAGEYDIDVYVPGGIDATNGAQYEIVVQDESGENQKMVVAYDQTSNPDSFATIATMDLPAGSKCSVILRDVVDSLSTGQFVVYDAIRFTNSSSVGIVNENQGHIVSDDIKIFPPYPNPFNPNTTLKYELSNRCSLEIGIYDIRGERIKTFRPSTRNPGTYSLEWDAKNDGGNPAASGVYLVSIRSNNIQKVEKILLIQ